MKNKRHLVQISAEQVAKLEVVKSVRKDLQGFPISKIVHILLQEQLAKMFNQKNDLTMAVENSPNQWLEYIRERIPLHTYALIALGVVRRSQEMIGTSFTKILVYTDAGSTIWCNWKGDIFRIGDFLLRKFKQQAFAQQYFAKYDQMYTENCSFVADLKNKSFSDLSDEELASAYDGMVERSLKMHALTFDIDAIDIVLDDKLKIRLRQLLSDSPQSLDNQQFNYYYGLFTMPNYISYLQQEKILLWKIEKQIRSQKQLYGALIKWHLTPELKEKITPLIKSYWWTRLGWNSGREKTYSDFLTELKDELTKSELSKEETKSSIVKSKDELFTKLKNDQILKWYLDIFEKYSRYHDYRKEQQMKLTYLSNKLLMEIARRKQIKFEDLQWCWPVEIRQLLQGEQIFWNNVLPRKDILFTLISENTIEEKTGGEALARKMEEINSSKEQITNFNGTIASSGKATGKAVICYSADEAIHKIKKGDILITSMTTPDFVPAMKSAGAIVTNEGGITCHAAIVSRELNIPCLVGTNIATKVINEGDIVEVNANHGVVKILEKSRSQ